MLEAEAEARDSLLLGSNFLLNTYIVQSCLFKVLFKFFS